MITTELAVGRDQAIVVYTAEDTGSEVDPVSIFTEIGADAERRAGSRWTIVSMAAVPTRHAAAFLARQGSGYETKVSIAVVYGRSG